jgi:hypothetical protein
MKKNIPKETSVGPPKVYFSGIYNYESEKKMFEHIFNFQFYEVTYMLDAGYNINHQVFITKFIPFRM